MFKKDLQISALYFYLHFTQLSNFLLETGFENLGEAIRRSVDLGILRKVS